MTVEEEAPQRDKHSDTVEHVNNPNRDGLTFGSSSILPVLPGSAVGNNYAHGLLFTSALLSYSVETHNISGFAYQDLYKQLTESYLFFFCEITTCWILIQIVSFAEPLPPWHRRVSRETGL